MTSLGWYYKGDGVDFSGFLFLLITYSVYVILFSFAKVLIGL
jgi:hypothetical protein